MKFHSLSLKLQRVLDGYLSAPISSFHLGLLQALNVFLFAIALTIYLAIFGLLDEDFMFVLFTYLYFPLWLAFALLAYAWFIKVSPEFKWMIRSFFRKYFSWRVVNYLFPLQ